MQRISSIPAILISASLFGQSPCADLQIEELQYAPFGNGIHVVLHNGTSDFLSYPTFDIVDAEGDTIVDGGFNFFGIAPGASQMHELALVSGTPLPTSPFNGTLELFYIDINGEGICTFQMNNVDLCPAEPCRNLQVYAYHQDVALTTDLDWSVTDDDNIVQASGVFHLDAQGSPSDFADLCLPPGQYTLNVAQAVAGGTVIMVGLMQEQVMVTDAPMVQLPIGGSVAEHFSYYGPCINVAQSIEAQPSDPPTIVIDGRTLRISTNDGSTLGKLVLLDGMGRIVRTINTNASSTSSDLSSCSSGAYILRSLDSDDQWPAQRFILH